MKIKNIRISILILAGLIVLSFAFFSAAEERATTDKNIFLDSDQDGLSDAEEKTYGTDPAKADSDGDSYSDGTEVQTGYDPLKPAPGDRVAPEENPITSVLSASEDEGNLTDQLMDKVTEIIDSPDATSDGIGMDSVNALVQQTIQEKVLEAEIPVVNKDGIKIKKQDYEKMTPEARAAQKKSDFLKYITTVSYILSSNSPRPITTGGDARSMADSFMQGLLVSMTTGNLNGIRDVIGGAEKSLKQMRDVEVPESELELHVKGLTFLNYALTFRDNMQPNLSDPIADLIKYSKMQSLAESSSTFMLEVYDKFSQYGIDITQPLNPLANNNAASGTATTQAIEVTSTPNVTSVPETGGDVIFTFKVKNASAEKTVTITSLSDSVFGTLAGDIDCEAGTVLAANADCSFSMTKRISNDQGKDNQTNFFTAHAKDNAGNDIFDIDDAMVGFTSDTTDDSENN